MSKISNKGANGTSALQPTLSIIVNLVNIINTDNRISIFNMVKMLKRTFSISTNVRRYCFAKPLSSLCPGCPIKVQMGPHPIQPTFLDRWCICGRLGFNATLNWEIWLQFANCHVILWIYNIIVNIFSEIFGGQK